LTEAAGGKLGDELALCRDGVPACGKFGSGVIAGWQVRQKNGQRLHFIATPTEQKFGTVSKKAPNC